MCEAEHGARAAQRQVRPIQRARSLLVLVTFENCRIVAILATGDVFGWVRKAAGASNVFSAGLPVSPFQLILADRAPATLSGDLGHRAQHSPQRRRRKLALFVLVARDDQNRCEEV